MNAERVERAYYAHMDPLFFAGISDHFDQHADLLCDYTIQMIKDAMVRLQDVKAFYHGALIESQMYARFGRLMTEFDVLVCPTVMSNKMTAGFNPAVEDYVVYGKVQEFDLNISTCHLFNMMGRCPAISIPSGIGDNGVPTGLHIAARAYDDVAVFRVAAALEKTCKPFLPPDPG